MEKQDMSDVKKPVSALYFAVGVVISVIFLSGIVGQVVLVGQPFWIRCTATTIGAVVMGYVFAFIISRFKRS